MLRERGVHGPFQPRSPKLFSVSIVPAGVLPPLRWRGIANEAELTLTAEDVDADHFVHWTVLRIPPDVG